MFHAIKDVILSAPPIQINKPKAPHLPWALLGAAGIIAFFGLALWKTTVGKVLIIGGIAVAGTVMVMNSR